MNEEKKLKIFDANLLYLLGAIIFIVIGSYVQTKNLLTGLLITQYLLILTPPILYLLVRKIRIKHALRLNPLRAKHGILIGFITILMYPAAVTANALMMFLMSLLGNLNIPQLPTAENVRQYALYMFIISISAGICEEVFFRGFILSGYRPLGQKKAIIISAVLFGIFHFNLYNLLGPIVLGLVFGYLVTLTDSLYAGIIGHIVNNGFAVTLGFIVNYFTNKVNLAEAAETAVEVSTTVSLLVSMLVFAVISIGTGFIALHLLHIIKKDIALSNREVEMEKTPIARETIEEVQPNEIAKVENTRFGEFVPLILVVPLYILVVFIQISEIIQLG